MTPPRRTTTPEDVSVRTALARSATELFNLNGYEATSVNDIVRHAKVTKGAFYHYYDSKADCLRLLHEEFIEGELGRLERAVAESEGPSDAVRRIIRTFLYGVSQHAELNRIFDHEWRHVEASGFEDIRRQRDRIAEIVTEQISAGVESGVFATGVTPRLQAFAIIGMCGWAHRWYAPAGSLSFEEIADEWADAVLGGILARPLASGPALRGGLATNR